MWTTGRGRCCCCAATVPTAAASGTAATALVEQVAGGNTGNVYSILFSTHRKIEMI